MGLIGGSVGYHILKRIGGSRYAAESDQATYEHDSQLERLLGEKIWNEIHGKVVIDFGCGLGANAVKMAQHGVARVYGIDIQEKWLGVARERARQAGVGDRCFFATETKELADVIVSTDAFEHFCDPADVLRTMRRLLTDTGSVIAAFGPTWYHPLGGHLFSVFPWAHLVFTEKALIRWRADFKDDGATRFEEVEGGLNQMTIHRFQRIVDDSEFKFASLETVPIRSLRVFANPLTREFTTAIVRCTLVPRS